MRVYQDYTGLHISGAVIFPLTSSTSTMLQSADFNSANAWRSRKIVVYSMNMDIFLFFLFCFLHKWTIPRW